MDENRLHRLLNQYFSNTIGKEDCELLLKYVDEGEPSKVSDAIDRVLESKESSVGFGTDRKQHVYDRLMSEIHGRQTTIIHTTRQSRYRTSFWLRIAAFLVATISVGILLYEYTRQPATPSAFAPPATPGDIALPERNQAILTLADGRRIVLDDSLNGIVAQESGVRITKQADGSVRYEAVDAERDAGNTHYNTFSTPKGHTYQLRLPDGTTVWLNTASSIRYPVAFTERERVVSLTGEAYFDVAHDASKPFNVLANGSTVQVLGTQFNVSAYPEDRQVTATLVTGAVNISKANNLVSLQPGQQAVVDGLSNAIHRSRADIRAALAWKEGYFRFDDESVEDIIDKISRWYDIDAVEYQGHFTERFSGTFRRSKHVSQLFSNLEKLAPIRFEVNERRVIIMK